MVTGALVGKVLASFVGAYIAPLIGWRYTFLLSVIPALITLYIRKSIKESDVWEHRKKDFNQPYSKVKTFCEIIFPKYRFIFIKSLILAFLGVSAYWFTNSWMPECFKIQRHLTGGETSLVVTIIQLGFIAGLLTFGKISDKKGRETGIYSLCPPAGIRYYGHNPFLGIFLLLILYTSNPTVLTGFATGIFWGFGVFFLYDIPSDTLVYITLPETVLPRRRANKGHFPTVTRQFANCGKNM